MRNYFLLMVVCVLFSCKPQSMEIFHLKDLSCESTSIGQNGEVCKRFTECFVIANIDENRTVIEKFIKNFNASTISMDKVRKYCYYNRVFYKESSDTPRDIRKNDTWGGWLFPRTVEIQEDLNGEDILVRCEWSDSGKKVFYYYRNR